MSISGREENRKTTFKINILMVVYRRRRFWQHLLCNKFSLSTAMTSATFSPALPSAASGIAAVTVTAIFCYYEFEFGLVEGMEEGDDDISDLTTGLRPANKLFPATCQFYIFMCLTFGTTYMSSQSTPRQKNGSKDSDVWADGSKKRRENGVIVLCVMNVTVIINICTPSCS
jgi:hypothetical protein